MKCSADGVRAAVSISVIVGLSAFNIGGALGITALAAMGQPIPPVLTAALSSGVGALVGMAAGVSLAPRGGGGGPGEGAGGGGGGRHGA